MGNVARIWPMIKNAQSSETMETATWETLGVDNGKRWLTRADLSTTPLKHMEEQKYSSNHA